MNKSIELIIDLETDETVLIVNHTEVVRGKPDFVYDLFTKCQALSFKSVEQAGYARKVVITRKDGKDYVAIRNSNNSLNLIYKL